MAGEMTFRNCINNNKKLILEYLTEKGKSCTSDICRGYKGEKEMVAVRKALNELREEGKVITDDVTHMWQGKFWELVTTK